MKSTPAATNCTRRASRISSTSSARSSSAVLWASSTVADDNAARREAGCPSSSRKTIRARFETVSATATLCTGLSLHVMTSVGCSSGTITHPPMACVGLMVASPAGRACCGSRPTQAPARRACARNEGPPVPDRARRDSAGAPPRERAGLAAPQRPDRRIAPRSTSRARRACSTPSAAVGNTDACRVLRTSDRDRDRTGRAVAPRAGIAGAAAGPPGGPREEAGGDGALTAG